MPSPYFNIGVFRTGVGSVDTTAVEELGIYRAEAGKILRYVKASAPIPAGESVRLDAAVTTGALIGGQVLQTSSPTDVFFGIAEATMPILNFGWVTVAGPATGRVRTGEIPGIALNVGTLTGVLQSGGATGAFVGNYVGLALQSGLSAGSAVYLVGL